MFNRFTFPNTDDFLEKILTRQPEIRRPTIPISQDNGVIEPPETKPLSLLEQFNSITKNRPAMEKLRELLGNAPTREAFKPHWSDRVEAALSGVAVGINNPAAGIATAKSSLDQKFNRASEDYEDNFKRSSILANLENSDIDDKLKGLGFFRDDRQFDTNQENIRADNARAQQQLMQSGFHVVENELDGTKEMVHSDGRRIKLGTMGESLDAKRKREDAIREDIQRHAAGLNNADNLAANQRNSDAIAGRADVVMKRIAGQKEGLGIKAANAKDAKSKAMYDNFLKLASEGHDIDEYVSWGGADGETPVLKSQSPGWLAGQFGATPDATKEAIRKRYADAIAGVAQVPASTNNAAPVADKRVPVIGPNGELGTMLESELAKSPGWRAR
jgi:hypothetical protein